MIRPQEGPQELFLSLGVDVAFYGGSAYGGKTWSLLMEAPRYSDDPNYTGIIFRRTSPELTTPGAIWDTAKKMYPLLGARMTEDLTVHWQAGGKLKFSHLQYESSRFAHHGGQYLFMGFDEIQTFTQTQVIYLMTRNRPGPGCKRRAYFRGTCNPDADSWLRQFLDWWINPETGYAIRERSGVVRYFTIEDDQFVWVEKSWRGPSGERPRSFTFVAGSIDDNKIGNEQDPSYRSTLYAQDRVTRERLLKGNWNVTYKGGMFDPDWFKIESPDALPRGIRLFRYWDMAATEVKPGKDPDFTAGVKGGLYDGQLWIVDAKMWRDTPGYTEREIKMVAKRDGPDVAIGIEEEKGSAGKHVMSHYQRHVLVGYEFHPDPVSGDKASRAKPVAALAEHGMVHLIQGPWNNSFKSQAASFPSGKRDAIDAMSGVYKMATGPERVWPAYNSSMVKELSIYRGIDEWKKIEPYQVVVLGTIVAANDGSISGNYYIWSRKTEKLWIYAEYDIDHPTYESVKKMMVEMADIPIDEKTGELFIAVRKVIGNDEMFSGVSEDMAHQLAKAGIRVRPCPDFDQPGMILRANSLIVNNQVTVGSRCEVSDQQYRSWTSVATIPEEGFSHCTGLLMVLAELKKMGEMEAAKVVESYSKEKTQIRERIRSLGRPTFSSKRTGDEWLER